MIQVSPLIKRPDQDNSFMGQAAKFLPVAGAAAGGIAGGVAGSAVPALGTTMGAMTGSGAGMAAGGALAQLMQKPQEQESASPIVPSGGGDALSRRLGNLKSQSDSGLAGLKQAALALPNLPPDLRQEAAHPIMTALLQGSRGQNMRG